MIEAKDFWGAISNDVREYLSMRYFGMTRCMLSKEQEFEIAEREIEEMENLNLR